MKHFAQSKWFYRILALFFALLLFFNANSSLKNNSLNQSNNNYTEMVTNVPITVQGLSSKYFVTMDVSAINVSLMSPNKVLLDSESNQQTRKFKAVINLAGKTPGTYQVPIKITHLNSAIDAKLSTKKVRVTITTRATKWMNVQTNVTQQWVATGYQLAKVTVSPKKVKVIGSPSDIQAIDKVEATLDQPDKALTHDMTQSASLKAYDVNGETLNVNFDQKAVSVTVDVSSPSKTVPINLMQQGTLPDGIDSYQFLCDTQTLTLHGTQHALDQIKSIDANIDISNIQTTETKQVTLSIPDGVTANMKQVTVTIIPHQQNNPSSTSASSTNQLHDKT